MIIVRLIGGLGNQMFQYSFGKSLSIQNNTELKLDRTFLDDKSPKENFTFRDFELDVFQLKPIFSTKTEINSFFVPSFFDKIRAIYTPKEVISEHILETPFSNTVSNKHLYFEGYWQNEFYFTKYSKEIREDFQFRHLPLGLNAELVKTIQNCNSISLHVRRGDYASNPVIQSVHGILGLDYYQKAILYLKDKIENPHYFVFSDDSDWCQSNLKIDFPTTYIDHNSGKNSFEDMRLMSLCKHNIIANSSFSWWGAWLNAHSEKIVIAPEKWFSNSAMPTEIIPLNWIKL